MRETRPFWHNLHRVHVNSPLIQGYILPLNLKRSLAVQSYMIAR